MSDESPAVSVIGEGISSGDQAKLFKLATSKVRLTSSSRPLKEGIE